MSVAGKFSLRSRREVKALWIALAIAMLAHGGGYAGGRGLFSFLNQIAKQRALMEMHRIQITHTNTPHVSEPSMVFVEVDPSAFSSEPPKDAKFYSSKSSKAANPDTQADTDIPKIDGTQEHVVKTEDVPRQKSFPLQPSVPKEATPKEAQPPKEVAETKPPATPKPGDLAKAAPTESKIEAQPQPAKETPRERPLTLAQAQAQQSPIMGQKMKQAGGVKRQHVASSLDVLGTPFGDYDERIVRAIQQRWYDLLDNENVSRHTGRVVVEFRLNYDGRITNMKVSDNTVGESLAYLCERAISEPAPYERWPSEMRLTVGTDYRDVKFTFYYD
jgi:hypothetical protein